MRRLVGTVLAVAGLASAAAVTTIVAAGWTDTPTASGNISVSMSPDLLYVCEWYQNFGGPCNGGDDSGADEIIFENDEQLLPGGGGRTWTLSLVKQQR